MYSQFPRASGRSRSRLPPFAGGNPVERPFPHGFPRWGFSVASQDAKILTIQVKEPSLEEIFLKMVE